jgi:hypothetical protein
LYEAASCSYRKSCRSSLVFAQEAATTAPAAPAAPAAEKKAPAKPANGVKKVAGSIVSVDAIANIVIIKTKKGEDTMTVNEKTAITVGGKTVALADLKADTKVTVAYKMEEGKKVATKITEKVAVKAKAKDTTAPAAPAAPATPAAPETK